MLPVSIIGEIMIRIFAIDIDGTLLNSNGNLDKKTVDALRDLEETGVRVVLNSGRVFSSVLYYARQISTSPVVIANNGAVLGTDYDNIILSHPLESDWLESLYRLSLENKLDFHFYDLDTYYADRFNEKKLEHLLKDRNTKGEYSVNLSISDDPIKILQEKDHKAYKFQINGLGDKESDMENIFREEFSEKLYFTSSINGVLEMMVKGVSKYKTVLDLASIMGLGEKNIAAIGDGLNDLEMIEGAKLSFAMENGKDELKKAADYVVASNDDLGIAEACKIIKEYNRCLI